MGSSPSRRATWSNMTPDEFFAKNEDLFQDVSRCNLPPGWVTIVDEFCTRLRNEFAGMLIAQVKEKFGTLRIYLKPGPSEAWEIATVYERMTETICERCGQPGELRSERQWLRTLCVPCNSTNEQ